VDLSTLSRPSDGFIIQGDADGRSGRPQRFAAAGDVNGDGIADLIVGARYGDLDGGERRTRPM
jgi:hypothetical protein